MRGGDFKCICKPAVRLPPSEVNKVQPRSICASVPSETKPEKKKKTWLQAAAELSPDANYPRGRSRKKKKKLQRSDPRATCRDAPGPRLRALAQIGAFGKNNESNWPRRKKNCCVKQRHAKAGKLVCMALLFPRGRGNGASRDCFSETSVLKRAGRQPEEAARMKQPEGWKTTSCPSAGLLAANDSRASASVGVRECERRPLGVRHNVGFGINSTPSEYRAGNLQ